MSDSTLDTAPTLQATDFEDLSESRLVHGSYADRLGILPPSQTWIEATPEQLSRAMAVWMSAVFVLCYAALPAVVQTLGWYEGALGGMFANLQAFLVTLAITMATVLALRPRIRVPRWGRSVARDPIAAAAAGSLAVLAVVHNITPGLRVFTDMSPTELTVFLGLNVVESMLFGVMLASLVKTRAGAFALGGAFQALFLGASIYFALLF